MKPSQTVAALALLILVPAMTLVAEGIEEGKQPANAEVSLSSRGFEKGDQTISLGVGVQAPMFVFDAAGNVTSTVHFYPGASLSFGYQYFISSGLAIRATISGSYDQTYAGNNLFIAPLSGGLSYWWSLDPFDVFASCELGGELLTASGKTAFGPFAKAGFGGFWRITGAWSAGIQAQYWLAGELHADSTYDRFANVLEVSLVAMYRL